MQGLVFSLSFQFILDLQEHMKALTYLILPFQSILNIHDDKQHSFNWGI